MNVAFVECGLPFAGKSYLARSIAECVGGRIVSFNDARLEGEASGLIRDGMSKEREWRITKQIGYVATLPPLDDKAPIINDGVNPAYLEREILRDWLFLKDYKRSARIPILIFLNPPPEEIYRRMAQNEQRPTRDPVSPDNFDRLQTMFEPPRPEEQAIELRSFEEAEAWVRSLPDNLEAIKWTTARNRLERILRKHRLPLHKWGVGGARALNDLTDALVSDELSLQSDLHRTDRGLAWKLHLVTPTTTVELTDATTDITAILSLSSLPNDPPLEAAL